MSNKNKQIQYNRAIDTLSYLVFHYPKPVVELLSNHGIFFRGKPSKEQLTAQVVELLKEGDSLFEKDLEQLINRLLLQENDSFWGIVKGAVGILGGLFKKKKRNPSNTANNAAAAQASAAKRDMEIRIKQMRMEQERLRREAETRRKKEEERRQKEALARQKREAAAKKKMTTILIAGAGVVVLGITAVIVMSSRRAAISYPYPPNPIVK